MVRALIDRNREAVEWLRRIDSGEFNAACPDVLYAEVANTVVVQQRVGKLSREHAAEVLDANARIPFITRTARSLAIPAWGVAAERGLSAYDACYVVLAETMGATLLTADRRMAAATPNAVLITQ